MTERTIRAPSPRLQLGTRTRRLARCRAVFDAHGLNSASRNYEILLAGIPDRHVVCNNAVRGDARAAGAIDLAVHVRARLPDAGGAQRARDDADYQRAVTAYRFWYPTVSMEATFQGTRDAGVEDNKAAMILAGRRRL
jgi:hypothetical protein